MERAMDTFRMVVLVAAMLFVPTMFVLALLGY
jgi:hypothetical protein